MTTNNKYILTSAKAIEFYNKNPGIDFNMVNELFVSVIQKINSASHETLSVNEIRVLLNSINNKVTTLEQEMSNNNKMIQMTYDQINSQKDNYVEQMKNIIASSDKESNILSLIRETNSTLIDKTIYSILQEMPKLNETVTKDLKQSIYVQQQELMNETIKTFNPLLNENKDKFSPEEIQKTIQQNYNNISEKLMSTFQVFFNQDSMFYQNNMELKNFQKNKKIQHLRVKKVKKN